MKIFVTSDIHGNKVIIDKLHKVTELCDLILICGDIGGKIFGSRTLLEFSNRQKVDAEYFVDVLKKIDIPCRFILGNDDWFEIEDSNYLIKAETIGKINLVPFELVLTTPFNTNREVNENKLEYELAKLNVDSDTIIVAHTPPLGCGDMIYNGQRVGSKSVRSWIEKIQPRIWFNGHIHEDFGVSEIDKTKVFNCACMYTDNILKGWIINTDTLDFESVLV